MCHFTGEVTYDCQDFLMDNGEVMPQAVVELLQTSNCKLVQEIAEVCMTSCVYIKRCIPPLQ